MKKAIVIGYGKNGQGNQEALCAMGYQVVVYDDREEVLRQIKELEHVTAWQDQEDSEGIDVVLKSPGVPTDHPIVKRLADDGHEILTDIEFFYRNFSFPVIAITGTNGKTTTTTLVGEIFKKAKRPVCVAGNIGTGILPCAVQAEPGTWFVLELSSFQLESCVDFRCGYSTIINLRPDHLSWHGGYEAYKAAKRKIWENAGSGDLIVVNQDDSEVIKASQGLSARQIPISIERELDLGCFIKDGAMVYRTKDECKEIANLDLISLRGKHNLQNIAVASALSIEAGISVQAIRETIKEFKGITHRFEWLGMHSKRGFFNDSKGTNTEASAAAVQAVEGPKVLIGGGYDKGETFDSFFALCKEHEVHSVVLMGETAKAMQEAAKKAGIPSLAYAEDMEKAVEIAMSLSNEGDWILLSPACASWDQYRNYEERGEKFRQVVMRIEETV